MAGVLETLALLSAQRSEWIRRAHSQLSADDRVAAAWLAGSEGSGRTDPLSDFDLFIALTDDAAGALDEVHNWLGGFGELVWGRETPRNAPADGRYVRATYQMDALCLFVDWYFQPASSAELGNDTRMLFDRVGLPRDRNRTNVAIITDLQHTRVEPPVDDWASHLHTGVGLFWLMVPVIAKYLARGWDDVAAETLDWLALTVEVLCEQEPPAGDPLDRLRAMVDMVERAHSRLRAAGVTLPPHEHATEWPPFAAELRQAGWRTKVPPEA